MFAVFLLTICNTGNAEGCKYDTQCKGNRICEEETCVDPGGANSDTGESDDSATPLGNILIEFPPFTKYCRANLEIDLGGHWITPIPGRHLLRRIPLGRTAWRIQGDIHCANGAFCVSNRSDQAGWVILRDGDTYSIDWRIEPNSRGGECIFRFSD